MNKTTFIQKEQYSTKKFYTKNKEIKKQKIEPPTKPKSLNKIKNQHYT